MSNEKLKSIKKVRFLLEDDNRPVAILETDGAVYRVNNRFRKDFGVKKISSIKDLDNISFNLWDKYLRLTNKKGHKEFNISLPLRAKENYTVKVQLIYCYSIGKIVAIFNIPPTLQQEKELESLKVFRKSDNLMVVFNRQGIIQDVNELTYEYFNLPREYFIGKNIRELSTLFPILPSEAEKYIQTAISKGHAEILQRFEKSPEDCRYYYITTFLDEETNMFLTRFADHTEKVVLKKRLAHKETLSNFGQLAASIAHEIRNPITTLKGFTQLLRNSTAEESMKYLTVIDDEINRMEEILNEMLVLSKPKTKERELISLRNLLTDMVNIVYPKAYIEGVTIIQTEYAFQDVTIYGDEAKLKQVLLNLLKNALEAMTSGGTITIEAEVTEDDRINLSIADTGKGMSVTQLNQIFMPFFTTRSEGTGLGLPFVIKTVEEHGGTISVSSEVGLGSKFTLSFPLASTNEVVSKKELSKTGWIN